jgi:hemoglobin/transferrin/lactoferrin receptor protein
MNLGDLNRRQWSRLRPLVMPPAMAIALGMGSPGREVQASGVTRFHSPSAIVSVASDADSSAHADSSAVPPVPRDSSAAGAPTRPSVADTVTQLPPINVQDARRTPASDRETSTRVRMDRATATRFLPQTVGDALATVPGVELVKTSPWASQLSIRGMTGDRVVLMVDGVRMNTVRGHGVQPSLVALDNVSSLEVLPGAGSAHVGSDALGGVVNVVTQRNLFADQPRTTAMVRARGSEPGAAYSQSGRLRIAGPHAGIEVGGGIGSTDYLTSADGRIPDSGMREENASVRGAARAGSATLDAEYSHYAARDIGLPGFTGGAVIEGSYPLQGRDASRVELSVKGSGAFPEFRVLGSHQNLSTHFSETAVESVYMRGRLVGTRTRATQDRVATRVTSAEPSLRFAGPFAGRVFGEYRRETADGPLILDLTIRDNQGGITSQTQSVTASVPSASRTGWATGSQISPIVFGTRLEGSVRYDELHSEADTLAGSAPRPLDAYDREWSAAFGAARAIGPVEPYGNVATGFRAPNLDERYFNHTVHGGLRLFGNPDLISETANSYEVGMRTSSSAPDWVRTARFSAYRSDADNLITFQYIGQLYGVPRFQYVNVRNARIQGLEAELRLRWNRAELGLSGTLPRGWNRDSGEPLQDLGPTRAMVEAVVPISAILPNGTVGARVRWSDAVTDVSPVLARPAYSTTSIQADAVFAGVRAVAAVNNLWNHSYREPLSFVPEPGRTFSLALTFELSGAWPASGH